MSFMCVVDCSAALSCPQQQQVHEFILIPSHTLVPVRTIAQGPCARADVYGRTALQAPFCRGLTSHEREL